MPGESLRVNYHIYKSSSGEWLNRNPNKAKFLSYDQSYRTIYQQILWLNKIPFNENQWNYKNAKRNAQSVVQVQLFKIEKHYSSEFLQDRIY